MTQLDKTILERQRRGGFCQWVIFLAAVILIFGILFGCCISGKLEGPSATHQR